MTNSQAAMKLKDEGNALLAKKEYRRAHGKYTAAIKEDGGSAVLYANRAAASMSMGKFAEAAVDARKATELDPSYAKGWGRLGAAEQELGSWSRAAEAYEKALAALPQAGLSPADAAQKTLYENNLRTMREKSTVREVRLPSVNMAEAPWKRAEQMRDRILPLGQAALTPVVASSAWVILGAYNEFKKGIETLEGSSVTKHRGFVVYQGRNDVLQSLSNAIVRDQRVFHMNNDKFIERYSGQLMAETKQADAWTEGGPDKVLEEAQKRIRRDAGWHKTRKALSTTVRSWIMRAFLTGGFKEDFATAVVWYQNAIDVLDQGSELWRDEPKLERGAIFQESIVVGVRALYLDAYRQAYALSKGMDPRYTTGGMHEIADRLIRDTPIARAAMPSGMECDPGFISSFFVYPIAKGHAVKGSAYRHEAAHRAVTGDKIRLYSKAAAEYRLAIETLPPDDEITAIYRCVLFDMLATVRAPVKELLAVCAALREALPKILAIWEHSAARKGSEVMEKRVLAYEDRVRPMLERGEVKEEDVVLPTVEERAPGQEIVWG